MSTRPPFFEKKRKKSPLRISLLQWTSCINISLPMLEIVQQKVALFQGEVNAWTTRPILGSTFQFYFNTIKVLDNINTFQKFDLWSWKTLLCLFTTDNWENAYHYPNGIGGGWGQWSHLKFIRKTPLNLKQRKCFSPRGNIGGGGASGVLSNSYVKPPLKLRFSRKRVFRGPSYILVIFFFLNFSLYAKHHLNWI